MNYGILTLLCLLPFAGLHANDLVKNGNFASGSSHWTGGKIVMADESGQIVPSGGASVLELTADRNAFVTAEQHIILKPGKSKMLVTVVAKSLNFAINGSSQKFNSDFEAGGTYGWSAVVFPKTDFCIRVDGDGHGYKPVNLTAGGSWQTITAKFDVSSHGSVSLLLLLAPGEGSILIRSVTMQEAK